jgi:murein DD-endopeptidase MepM/ murein hydrolase activator NlpD
VPAVAIAPVAPVAPAARARWVPPLGGPLVVLAAFDPPLEDWLPGHRGVDLLAAPGGTVVASGPGIVVWAAPVAGRGVVSVLHDDGLRTTYEPVDPDVVAGQLVVAGEPLGSVAADGGHCGASPACLHWGLRRDRAYLDPLLLLRAGVPVLLPLPPGWSTNAAPVRAGPSRRSVVG